MQARERKTKIIKIYRLLSNAFTLNHELLLKALPTWLKSMYMKDSFCWNECFSEDNRINKLKTSGY